MQKRDIKKLTEDSRAKRGLKMNKKQKESGKKGKK